MSRSELEGLPEVFIIQLGVLTAQVVPVRIQGDRLKRTPNRDTEITDARLTTEPIRITCYSVEAHFHLFLRSIISKDFTDLNRAAPGTASQGMNLPHWSARRSGTGSFYSEGSLLWIEVDILIRGLTDGERSLDDFCRLLRATGTTDLIIVHEDLFWITQIEIPEGGNYPASSGSRTGPTCWPTSSNIDDHPPKRSDEKTEPPPRSSPGTTSQNPGFTVPSSPPVVMKEYFAVPTKYAVPNSEWKNSPDAQRPGEGGWKFRIPNS